MYIVGLGNIGNEYARTRHNIGFMVLDTIAARTNLVWSNKPKFKAEMAPLDNDILVKPTTYMNLSGEAVQNITSFYKHTNKDIVVIYDDVDMELGKIRLRDKGSDGGHRGIRSIINQLGTDEFKRIKMGVKSPLKGQMDTAAFVLGRFNSEEEAVLNEMIDKTIQIINVFIVDGWQRAVVEAGKG